MSFRPLSLLGRPNTIADVLARRADRTPDALAYVFTEDAVTDVRLTYRELDAHARAVAHVLISQGAARSRVVIATPPGLPFVWSFFGTLYARSAAIPVALPRVFAPTDDAEHERLKRICIDCKPSLILTTGVLVPFIETALQAQIGDFAPKVIAIDELDPLPAGMPSRLRTRPGDVALIQYSSGSTEAPRGVLVRHENIMANQKMILDAFGHDETTIVGGWLPHYHDMGLIGILLHPMYLGTPSYFLPPLAFAQRPHLWLKLIDRYRVNSSAGPSFAYEITARRTTDAQIAGLDLSCWKVALDGSEPVRAEAHRRFAERFAMIGFDASAFAPSYGLAEATVFVTGGRRRERVLRLDVEALSEGRVIASTCPDAIEIVGCGRGHYWQTLRIVDPDRGEEMPDGRIGEIWVKGPHVASGYFARPEITAETFGAKLGTEGPFLRTGDLGFLLDGELFVTGRLKDLIIVHGKNHHPHDLEATFANSIGSIPPRRVIALGDEASGSVLMIVELGREEPPLSDHDLAVGRRAVFRGHGLPVSEVIEIPAGAMPRTPSGKKQRRRMRELLNEGVFVPRTQRSA